MFTHNIDPILFNLGPLEIRYYGLAYILGFILAYSVLYKASDLKKLSLTRKQVDDYLTWCLLGVVVGGRLGYFLFYSPSTFFTNTLEVLKVWNGGMSFHGALIGVGLVTYYYSKKNKLGIYEPADLLSVPGLIALGLGRIANFINGEIVGVKTAVAWCVDFGDGCRHPVQLYLAGKNFLVAGFLHFLSKKEREPGFIFWNFVLFYGLGRFILDWRIEPRYFGFTIGQYLCLIMVILGIYMLRFNKKK